jgi:hypothetical protein
MLDIFKTIWNYLFEKNSEENNEPDLCAICLEELKDKLITLDCGHIFHDSCVQGYVRSTNDRRCPLCRYSPVEEEFLPPVPELVRQNAVHEDYLPPVPELRRQNAILE